MTTTKKQPKPYTRDDFRAELKKRMPGYKWTVKRGWKGEQMANGGPRTMSAEGFVSSGSNRLSTLHVGREVRDDGRCEVRVAVFPNGTHSHKIADGYGETVAQGLRTAQDLCGWHSRNFGASESYMAAARRIPGADDGLCYHKCYGYKCIKGRGHDDECTSKEGHSWTFRWHVAEPTP